MLGKVVRDDGEYVLGDDGRWSGPDPDVALTLQRLFDPQEATGMAAVMPYGRMSVVEAARVLKGEAVFDYDLPPLPDGVVS